jgi:hypothetical protein
MMIFLPIFVYCAIAFLVHRRWGYLHGQSVRDSLLISAVCWAVLLLIISECAGAFHSLHRIGLCAGWGLAAAGVCVAVIACKTFGLRGTTAGPVRWPPGIADRLVLLGLLLLCAALFTVALAAPPNTWDSMTYHLSRVMHWAQNRSLDFYPSNSLRQLFYPPFAEQAVLNAFILWGSDRLVNLIQFFAMLFCLVVVSCIAREFGAGRNGQILAAVIAATLPMLVLQATGTQNDIVLSLWILCLAYFLIKLGSRRSWLDLIGAAFSLGLALSTKGTALLFAPPLLVIPLFMKTGDTMGRKYTIRPIIALTIAVLVSLAIIAPHSYRNYRLFGGPFGPPQNSLGNLNVANDRLTPGIFFANIVRNLAIHTGTPFPKVNKSIERTVYNLLGNEISNPASTWPGSTLHIRMRRHEDGAGNPLHLIIITLSLLMLFTHRRRFPGFMHTYLFATIAGFLLFSLLLRWQPFHSRLMLPLFLLCAPLTAAVFAAHSRENLLRIAMAVLLVSSLPWVAFNKYRPLFGQKTVFSVSQTTQYFAVRPELEPAYRNVVAYIAQSGAATVGLAFSEDDWEYPLHALLDRQCPAVPEIDHVLVQNPSAVLAKPLFKPDVIISSRGRPYETLGTVTYNQVLEFNGLRLLTP